ncbi:MAG TPA: hypothetical protein DD636_09560, partial [Anaerolineaceae bacterium]|nr:hypothetical protein [Anaerolineaceae bacterium]
YVNNNPLRYTDPSGHCIFGVDTVVCITVGLMIAGAVTGYGIQVYDNMQQGMSFSEALTTDISFDKILSGAVIGGGVATVGIAIGTTVGIMTTASTAATAACADGDCTNEAQTIVNTTNNVLQNSQTNRTTAIQTYWPPNDGFLGQPSVQTLNSGTVIERIGDVFGRYAAPLNTSFSKNHFHHLTTHNLYMYMR